jgi:serine/threonine protein kinase
MYAGSIVAGRFHLLERVAQGGMGAIFRAADLSTNTAVALKVMIETEGGMLERFALEAKTLASLDHPAIVRYVAHGSTDTQQPYLAMEWLEGEDLSHALRQRAFSTAETLTIVRRVASALATAHAHNLVHRDLKPANIFLRHSDPSLATLVDFGVVHTSDGAAAVSRRLTRTGAIVGTVGYMSPEQWQGAKTLDGRADLFALGCVAFECLTGRAAFAGDSLAAVVASVLLGETPRVREYNPQVIPELDALVARMMHKDPDQRFLSATALLQALSDVEPACAVAVQSAHTPSSARVLPLEHERTPSASVLCWSSALAPTRLLSSPQDHDLTQEYSSKIADRWGAIKSTLAGGAILLHFTRGAVIHEKVERAARAALDLRAALAGYNITVSLSQSDSAVLPVSPQALQAHTATLDSTDANSIILDPRCAAMLGANFSINAEDNGTDQTLRLLEYNPQRDELRRVLGRDSPCVGREKELRFIEGAIDECCEDKAPHMVVLTGAQGVGKSRVRREVIARITDRPGLIVALARADLGTPLSAFAVIKQWIFATHGLQHTGNAEQQWARFVAAVRPVCAATEAKDPDTLVAFLGELVGVSSEPQHLAVRDARERPETMWAQLRLAFCSWMTALTAQHTVVLVLEDLHWADSASVSLLTSCWDQLGKSALFVLLTSWPEGESRFASLFTMHNVQQVKLDTLSQRAADKIAKHLLQDAVSPEVRAQVVELAGGNAFVLEEMIRHVGAHNSLESLARSGLALVQARLAKLPLDARRVLRLASVIGEQFYRSMINDLMADRATTPDGESPSLDAILMQLTRAELLTPDGAQWRFRHALVRQAAYEMLTESDRAAAHRAVAEWLQAHRADEPAMIAEHYEQSGMLSSAGPWFYLAIEQAERLGQVDLLAELVRRCDRDGVAADLRASAVFRGFYRSMSSGSKDFIAELDARLAAGDIAHGSMGWFLLKSFQVVHKQHLGVKLSVLEEIQAILQANVSVLPTFECLTAYSFLLGACMQEELLTEATEIAQRFASLPLDKETQAFLICTRDSYLPLLYTANDDPRALTTNRTVVELARAKCGMHTFLEIAAGFVTHAIEFGAYEESQRVLDELYRAPLELHGYLYDNVIYAEAKLAAHGAIAVNAEHLVAKIQRPEMRHQTLRIRAFCAASAAFAEPCNQAIVWQALTQLRAIADECGPMHRPRFIAELLSVEVLGLMGEFEAVLTATDKLVQRDAATPSGQRTRLKLARLRALQALGLAEQLQTERARATERLHTIAAKLQGQDRDNFFAMPPVRQTLSL